MIKSERVKTENQKAKEWIDRLKRECKGLTQQQKNEVLLFTKYSAWRAIETKFDEL